MGFLISFRGRDGPFFLQIDSLAVIIQPDPAKGTAKRFDKPQPLYSQMRAGYVTAASDIGAHTFAEGAQPTGVCIAFQ